MTDESDLRTIVEEPSIDDFEAVDEERPPAGATAVLFRILRAIGTLLVILALLLYFVVPFRNAVSSVAYRLRLPRATIRTIPLAPERTTSPTLPV